MLPSISRPNEKGQPPKKVIRALGGYKSAAPQELSFSKGDFFHVIRDPDEASNWYEANNPVTGARGLVPKNLFEEFSKGNAACVSLVADASQTVSHCNRQHTRWPTCQPSKHSISTTYKACAIAEPCITSSQDIFRHRIA
jgi:hypothetical protein